MISSKEPQLFFFGVTACGVLCSSYCGVSRFYLLFTSLHINLLSFTNTTSMTQVASLQCTPFFLFCSLALYSISLQLIWTLTLYIDLAVALQLLQYYTLHLSATTTLGTVCALQLVNRFNQGLSHFIVCSVFIN